MALQLLRDMMHMNPQTSDTNFLVNKRPAPNANHQNNHTFSLRKTEKRVMPKRWAKPSKSERDTCYGTLESVEILHCGVCFRQDDMHTSDMVEPL